MAPPKKSNCSSSSEPTRRRTRAQVRQEMATKRKKQKTSLGSDPFKPRLIDSDSDQEIPPSLSSSLAIVPFIPFVPLQTLPPVSSPEPPGIEEIEDSESSMHTESPAKSAPAKSSSEKSSSSEFLESQSGASLSSGASETVSSGSSAKAMTDVEDAEVATDIFPPLPADEVTLREYVSKKLKFEIFDRKASCQYNQSKLEQEFPDVWVVKNPFSHKFLLAEGVDKFQLFKQYALFPEKIVPSSHPENKELLSLLAKSGLIGSVQDLEAFGADVVLEFYANFKPVQDDFHDISFVYVRGKLFEFSPRMIDHVLGLTYVRCSSKDKFKLDISENKLASEMTENELTVWQSFTTSYFSDLLNALYIVCCRNWMPSTNHTYVREDRARLCYKVWKGLQLNLGKIIYDQVAALVINPEPSTVDRRKILPFPALIYRVLEFQKAIPLGIGEMVEPGLKDIKIDSTRRVRRSPSERSEGYQPGLSQSADLDHIMKLLVDYKARLAGGDYVGKP